MAIDSREKRQSAAWVGYPGPVSVFPFGTIDQPARQQIGWTYMGLLVGGATVVLTRLRTLMGVGV